MFEKKPFEEIISKYNELKSIKEEGKIKKRDIIDKDGRVQVFIRKIPTYSLIGKIDMLEKMEKVVEIVGEQPLPSKHVLKEVPKESLPLKEVKETQKPKKPEKVKGEEKKKKEKVIEGLKKLTSEKEGVVEKLEEVPKVEEVKEKVKKPSPFKNLIKELMLEVVKEEKIIEDKERYEKVKEGVGISYIDDHKPPRITCPLPEESIEQRSEMVVEEIIESSRASQSFSKAELSKKLIELTRLFLKAKTRKEKEEIKAQILEVKHALKSKEGKTIDPLETLRERQKERVGKLISSLKMEVFELLESVRNSYKEALALAGKRKNLIEKIEKLKEEDIRVVEGNLEECIGKLKDYFLELHKKEITRLCEKLGKDPGKEIKEIEEGYEMLFKELLMEVKEKIRGLEAEGRDKEITKETLTSTLTSTKIEELKKDLETWREGKWLHYLGEKNRKEFWKYIRGEMSKEEAIKKAKLIYIENKAVELKLSEGEIKSLKEIVNKRI